MQTRLDTGAEGIYGNAHGVKQLAQAVAVLNGDHCGKGVMLVVYLHNRRRNGILRCCRRSVLTLQCGCLLLRPEQCKCGDVSSAACASMQGMAMKRNEQPVMLLFRGSLVSAQDHSMPAQVAALVDALQAHSAVSPPAWQAGICNCKQATGQG